MQITPLPRRRSFNCYSGCVTAVLERKGFAYSEPVAVALSGGLNLEFSHDGPLHFRGVRRLHCITEFLEERGLHVTRNVAEEDGSFEAAVAQNIENDKPTMVEYDGFYMPYTQIHGKKHERRIGLIVGASANSIRITDPIYGVEGYEVSSDLFAQSRSVAAGAAVEPAWYDVEMDEETGVDPGEVGRAVRETADYMLQASDVAALLGVQGLRSFASEAATRLVLVRGAPQLEEFSEELKQGAILFDHYAEFLNTAPALWHATAANTWRVAAGNAEAVASHFRTAAALVWKSAVGDPVRCGARLSRVLDSAADEAASMFGTLRAS